MSEGPSSLPRGLTSLGEAALLHPGTFSVCLSLDPGPFFLSSRGTHHLPGPWFLLHKEGEHSFSLVSAVSWKVRGCLYGAEGRVTFKIPGFPQESPSCPQGAHCRHGEQNIPAGITGGLRRLPTVSISAEESCADVMQGQQAPGL